MLCSAQVAGVAGFPMIVCFQVPTFLHPFPIAAVLSNNSTAAFLLAMCPSKEPTRYTVCLKPAKYSKNKLYIYIYIYKIVMYLLAIVYWLYVET